MTQTMIVHGGPALDLLAALRAAAPSDAQARSAFNMWNTVQAVGWSEARRLRKHASWYRHLSLLADAGVSVPLRPYGDRRPAACTDRHGSITFADIQALVGCGFTVTEAWDPHCYPVDTTGTVSAVLFRDAEWSFELAYDGSPGGHEFVPVRTFFECCSVSEGGPDAG